MTLAVRAAMLVAALAAIAATAFACGGDSQAERLRAPSGVTVEARSSPTPSAPVGGKPAAPRATATAEARPTEEPAVVAPQVSDLPTQAPAPPTAAVEPTVAPTGPPTSGRWIEVDVTAFVVRLMDGGTVLQEIAPVGVGEQIDTGEYLSTQTGLFYVYNKAEALVYDAPYDTYISHWVGFDPAKDNGFHSLLKDASGAVVDASTGRVSNGCIRTGAAEALFAFAEIGMPVWVHA